MSSGGNEGVLSLNDETPATDRGYRKISSSDNGCQKWRRRESNPQTECHSTLENKVFCASQKGLAADWQRFHCQQPIHSDNDTENMRELAAIAAAWLQLPDSIRKLIVALVKHTLD